MQPPSTILVVDDEPVGRETLDALLFMEGYQLVFANDGPQALMKAAYLVPDLILLDVMMPGMDGFEVCRRLRADTLLAEVPVIMVTALDDRDSRLRGLEAGADDFVSKPFDRLELRARVRTVTRLNRYRRMLLERSKFEWVVEEAADGYVMLSDDDQLLYANARARQYLGLPLGENEAIARSFSEIVADHYRREPGDAWAPWPDQGATPGPRYLVRPTTTSDAALWLQVEQIEMTSRSTERYLVRLRNVTDEIAQRTLQWTFQALVNHKLRTPLGGITGFLEILDNYDHTLSAPEKKQFIATARTSAKELDRRIRRIFEYMQSDAAPAPGRASCSAKLIRPIVADLTASLGLRPCALSYDGIVDAEDVEIPLSPQAVEVILGEMIDNAHKFHPDRSPALELALSALADRFYLRLADDGRGLSPDQLSKIWAPYYQAEKVFSGEVAGMGLGLASVAARVWTAGGTCRAYNRPDGPGLVVELCLPWSSRQA